MKNGFPDSKTAERVRTLYPTGTRVAFVSMDDPYTKLKPGDMGTVAFVDDALGVHINWDDGSTLAAIFGIDEIRKVEM